MKVSISVGGRFHAFDLAGFLEKNGYLNELITSYPAFTAKPFGVPEKKVKSILVKELVERFFRQILKLEFPKPVSANLYDWLASFRFSKGSDIYIIWSSYALISIKRIRKKNKNATIVLERGSAHIAVQNKLLVSVGVKRPVWQSIIQKEEKEYQKADFISLPSQFSMQTFLDCGIDPKKLNVNPYGVDLSGFLPNRKKEPVFCIGYVGVMSSQKNVKGLIEACEQLIDKGYSLKLLLVGGLEIGGVTKEFLTSFGWVDYVGKVPQSELQTYYCKMDLFVLNSVQDGFGMVILQALACGVPVIATENTGAPDVVRDGINGYIIPVNATVCLSDKIRFLIENPNLLPELSHNARKSVDSGFSWDDYGNRYINFLLSLKTQTQLQ